MSRRRRRLTTTSRVYGADVLDVLLLDADRIAEAARAQARDDPFAQVVEGHNDRAWRVVLESCRGPNGKAGTVLDAARAMGDEGLEGGGAGPGIETLVVMLGANNALGTVVHLDARWTPTGLPRPEPTQAPRQQGCLQRVAASAFRR